MCIIQACQKHHQHLHHHQQNLIQQQQQHQDEPEYDNSHLKLTNSSSKCMMMDESLCGGVTSRSGSMSLLSSSYSIKSRMSSQHKASTPTELADLDARISEASRGSGKMQLQQQMIKSVVKSNNTSCSSGCSSAASSTNLSRSSRMSSQAAAVSAAATSIAVVNRPDSSLSSISTGYQSSSARKHEKKRSIKLNNNNNSNNSQGNVANLAESLNVSPFQQSETYSNTYEPLKPQSSSTKSSNVKDVNVSYSKGDFCCYFAFRLIMCYME